MSARSHLRRPPRRHHRPPQPVYSNAHQIAMRGAQQLERADVEGMRRLFDRAVDEFIRGINCPQHWRRLADACNLAETMAAETQLACDEASRAAIAAAQRVLADVAGRHQLRGSWTLHAAEIDTLRVAVLIHNVQLQQCSHSEFARAYDLTRERITQALAGNAPPGAIVVKGSL